MAEGAPAADAALALTLLAVDPFGLGGATLRGRAGGPRDALLPAIDLLPAPAGRVAPTATDGALFGGMDVVATLAAGRVIQTDGVLGEAATLLLRSAERIGPSLAARIAVRLDHGNICALALDEGVEDETVPAALRDRLAFALNLDHATRQSIVLPGADVIADARARLPRVRMPADVPERIAALTLAFGIDSQRAAIFALQAARAHAALKGRTEVAETDLEVAARLVLAPRATRIPEPASEETPPPPQDTPDRESHGADGSLPDDILLEAVRAALPPGLLDARGSGRSRSARGSGSGARRKGNRRGRPLPSRPGRPDGSRRIDVLATLRAAAPWQRMRGREPDGPIRILASDIHLHRYEELSDRLIIFAVDASGSAAFARLAEAKGAVELLLAEAYSRRDHVALIAFRGNAADLLLPPTRSLVLTKRRLAALPGGGGTPLALGIEAAVALARQAEGRGMTPRLVLLTDGRGNICRDGTPDRALAAAEAGQAADLVARAGLSAICIDTGRRPDAGLRQLGDRMGASYLAMPRVDARGLGAALAQVMD